MTWLRRCRRRRVGIVAEWRHALVGHRWPRPAAAHRTGTGTDWARTRGQLLAENALLRRMRQKSDNAWWERPDSGSVAALTAA